MDCGAVKNLLGFNCLPNLMEWKDNAKSTLYRVGNEVLQRAQERPKLVIGSVVAVVVFSIALGSVKAISAVALPIILLTALIYKISSKAEPTKHSEGEKEIEYPKKDNSETNSVSDESDIEDFSGNELTTNTQKEALHAHIQFCFNYLSSKTSLGTDFNPVAKDCDNLKNKLTELKDALNETDQAKIQELIDSAIKLKVDYSNAYRAQYRFNVLDPSVVQDFQNDLNKLYQSSWNTCREIYNS